MTESVAAFKFIISEREKKSSGKRFNMENNDKNNVNFSENLWI